MWHGQGVLTGRNHGHSALMRLNSVLVLCLLAMLFFTENLWFEGLAWRKMWTRIQDLKALCRTEYCWYRPLIQALPVKLHPND